MKYQICQIGKKIYDKGLAPGASGNISCKSGDKILLTPSGESLGEMSEDDIVTTDINGNIIDGAKTPSSEKFMHYEIYKKRPDVTCIIHAHPPKTTALAVMGINLNTNLIAEAIVSLGQVPVVTYETPSSTELAGLVAEELAGHDAVIMANHGATVVADNINEAFYRLETLEFLSEINIITQMTGRKVEIPAEKMNDLLKIREQKYGIVSKL